MVWSVGRGIADEKNGRGTRLCRATHHRAWAKAKHLFDWTWGIWLFGFSPEGGTRTAGVRKPNGTDFSEISRNTIRLARYLRNES
jgi:hypothetical protein